MQEVIRSTKNVANIVGERERERKWKEKERKQERTKDFFSYYPAKELTHGYFRFQKILANAISDAKGFTCQVSTAVINVSIDQTKMFIIIVYTRKLSLEKNVNFSRNKHLHPKFVSFCEQEFFVFFFFTGTQLNLTSYPYLTLSQCQYWASLIASLAIRTDFTLFRHVNSVQALAKTWQILIQALAKTWQVLIQVLAKTWHILFQLLSKTCQVLIQALAKI